MERSMPPCHPLAHATLRFTPRLAANPERVVGRAMLQALNSEMLSGSHSNIAVLSYQVQTRLMTSIGLSIFGNMIPSKFSFQDS